MMTTSNTTDPVSGTTTLTDTTTNDLDVEVVEELYPWTDDDNERRRAFIFEYFNFNPDIAIKPQLEALASLESWLKGQAPLARIGL